MLAITLNEADVDMLAEMAANIQRWLVAAGLNAQLYHFNQEYLRLIQRGADTKQLTALLSRWRLIIVPYMQEAIAPKQFVSVGSDEPDRRIQIELVR